nr:hypothetical protein [Bacteroidaceae bacterium]
TTKNFSQEESFSRRQLRAHCQFLELLCLPTFLTLAKQQKTLLWGVLREHVQVVVREAVRAVVSSIAKLLAKGFAQITVQGLAKLNVEMLAMQVIINKYL